MMHTREATAADSEWIANLIRERWHSPFVVTKGRKHDTRRLPGIVACEDSIPVGLLLYSADKSAIEIVTLDALIPRKGIGRLLLDAISKYAARHGIRRLWLITTNDNTAAISFYTACGFRLVAVHPGGVARAREIKPEIPIEGIGGVPIRDELEFENNLPDQALEAVRNAATPPADAGHRASDTRGAR